MAITLRQKKGLITAAGTSAPAPAWGTPTVAGNLLLIIANETGAFQGTWSTPPTGYTAVSPTPSIYWTANTDAYGIFWKIAAGSDATPGNVGVDSGSGGPWAVYTYEFVAPNGWLSTPIDKTAISAAGNVAATTKASGSTAALAQANELAIAVVALSGIGSALTFTGGFTVEGTPTGGDGSTWLGWQETAATTALATTASWTTSLVNGCRIATFKTAAASGAAPARQLALTGAGT